jgi:hypothetical protein
MHGRVQDQVDGMLADFVKPITDILRRIKMSLAEWGEYAMLRHVEERNRWFVEQQELNAANQAEIEALTDRLDTEELTKEQRRELRQQIRELQREVDAWQKRTGGKQYDHEDNAASGVATKDAKSRMAKMEAKYGKKALDDAGVLLDQMNRASLKLRLDNGLISRQQYQEFLNRWDHYVPLQTAEVDEDAYSTPSTKSFQTKGREFEMAKGRTTEADNSFVWSVRQAFVGIERGERNRVGQAFANLVKANPKLLADQAAIEPLEEGQEPPEDSFTFKRNGKEYVVRVDAKLARAMKALDLASVPKLLQFIRPVMTWLRRARTSWNPDFILPNFSRDLGMGLIVLSKEGKEGLRREVLKTALGLRPQPAP